MIIYHITYQLQWENALQSKIYIPENYSKDGFIHCSKKEQVIPVAQRFYAGIPGLIVLAIDTEKLAVPVIEENLEGGTELFPHIYGQLPTNAVMQVHNLQNRSGKFSIPEFEDQTI